MLRVLSLIRSHATTLMGVCGLSLLQAACAHPVVVEPAVVVQARLGGPVYGSVYAPLYSPPPVVVAPQPMWIAPPPVLVAPRMWGPPDHRHHHRHGWRGVGGDPGWGRRGW